MNFIMSLVIGKWAKVFWPAVIIITALTTVYMYWEGRNDTIEDQAKMIRDLQHELIVRKNEYEANEKAYKSAIADQNSKIEYMHTQFVKAEQDAKIKINTINVQNQALNTKLKDQLSLIHNLKHPESCQAAIDLMVDIAIHNKWPLERVK